MVFAPSAAVGLVVDHAMLSVEYCRVFAPSVTVTVNAPSLVSRSDPDAPVSLSSAMVGADGPVVSTVTATGADAALALPAVSTARATILCAPSDSTLAVICATPPDSPPVTVWVPTTAFPLLVSTSCTTSPVATPETSTAKVGVLSLVTSSVSLLPLSDAATRSGAPGALGAVVSMVTDTELDAVLMLPAPSTARAEML